MLATGNQLEKKHTLLLLVSAVIAAVNLHRRFITGTTDDCRSCVSLVPCCGFCCSLLGSYCRLFSCWWRSAVRPWCYSCHNSKLQAMKLLVGMYSQYAERMTQREAAITGFTIKGIGSLISVILNMGIEIRLLKYGDCD